MTRRVAEKLCTRKVCVDFLAPKKVWAQLARLGLRAKPGRFGSSAFAMKIGISGESAP